MLRFAGHPVIILKCCSLNVVICLQFIRRQTRLKKLHASTNYVSTNLLNELENHAHSLESLCIASKYVICKRDDSRRDPESLLPIAKCCKLKKLHFNQMVISDEFAVAVIENLLSLNELKLGLLIISLYHSMNVIYFINILFYCQHFLFR